MAFEQYLSAQMNLHKSMQFQDLVKLCFQAAYGAEHLIADKSWAAKTLEDEFNNVIAADIPLYEEISDDTVRINLAAWKYRKLPVNWLLNIFFNSAKKKADGTLLIEQYLKQCRSKLNSDQWDAFVAEYREKGMHPVHHSEQYREAEKPFYRVVDKRYIRLLPILEAIIKADTAPCVITIEGRAASGKTTLAGNLASVLECDTIHMDDFFLPPKLRTEERLNEPGGNIDYDRFNEEVISKLRTESGFSYQIFSCSKMELDGKRNIKSEKYRIVEGVYSAHPKYGDYADIYVFTDVDSDTQMERIMRRDGEALAKRFATDWIPMEEKYFEEFKIADKCTIKIK